MKLKVLGSSGAESGGCNLPAFLVDQFLLLDAGTISPVMSRAEQSKIHGILITHAHLDHIRGVPFLADNLHMSNRRHGVTVISINRVLKALKDNLFNNVIWPDFTRIPDSKHPVLKFKNVSPGQPFHIWNYKISAYRVHHPVPAVGYIIEDLKGKRLLYTGDTGPTDTIWKAAKGIQCVIMEVSFPNRMKEVAVKTGHLTPALLKQEISKLGYSTEKILVTHSKPQYLVRINREIENLRMKNIQIVRDGDMYEI